jgi:hypothetical protein
MKNISECKVDMPYDLLGQRTNHLGGSGRTMRLRLAGNSWKKWLVYSTLLIFCGSDALAQSSADVAKKISGIELFETVAMGRGVDPFWRTQLQLLPSDKPIDIKLFLNAGSQKTADLTRKLERFSTQLRNLIVVTTAIEPKRITTEFREIDDLCSGALPILDGVDDNRLLIFVGSTEDECFDRRSAQLAMTKILDMPRQKADLDLAKNDLIMCASRLVPHRSSGGRGDAKTMVVFASMSGDTKDLRSPQHCIFDRALSFLGFRGRIAIDQPKNFDEWTDRCGSIRCHPTYEAVPTVKDLMMTAAMYKFLVNEDYSTQKQKIAAYLKMFD